VFTTLIRGRFGELGIQNNILHLKEYYRELIFEMVNSKKGILQVLSCDNEPMAVTFSFLSKKNLFYAITTFNTDLRRYNVGHILVLNLLKWCYENDMEVLDFSKGDYEYKRRWANEEYTFENHILFDNRCVSCKVKGNILALYFRVKQALRNAGINTIYARLKFLTKHKVQRQPVEYRYSDLQEIDLSQYTDVSPSDSSYLDLRSAIFDILYSNPEPCQGVQLYRKNDNMREYALIGQNIKKRILTV
jgi:CelD/BcsL family acetyltransferase involved in cellulose biosynthesis